MDPAGAAGLVADLCGRRAGLFVSGNAGAGDLPVIPVEPDPGVAGQHGGLRRNLAVYFPDVVRLGLAKTDASGRRQRRLPPRRPPRLAGSRQTPTASPAKAGADCADRTSVG